MKFFLVILILFLSVIYLSESKKVKEGKQETTKTNEEKKKAETNKKTKDEGGENKKKLKEKENKKQIKPDKEKKKAVVEKTKSSPKIVETVSESEEIITSKKKKQGKQPTKAEITQEDDQNSKTILVESKKIMKATKIDIVPQEKSKKIIDARKRRQAQSEKEIADKKHSKNKRTREPHAFETCDNSDVAMDVYQNECESGKFESNASDDVVVSVIETANKVTSTVEHPHENDVV